MPLLRKFIRHFFSHLSLYLFVFLVIFTFDRRERWRTTKDDALGPFVDDVAEYYAFLPAMFTSRDSTSPDPRMMLKDRRTIGMAMMYAPFFIGGHLHARLTYQPADGYSVPYQDWIHAGTLIYALLAIWLCRLSLLRFFGDTVVCITLVCVYMGTNLFFYTYGMGEMPHSYLFFLYAVFIFSCLRFFERRELRMIALAGLAGGMITLIRATDALILLFPLLFGISRRADFIGRLNFFKEQGRKIALAAVFFTLPWIAQIIYWKQTTGHFIAGGYGEEGFFFTDPQIANFLLSFRKGWLIYTPIMIFSIAGIFLSIRYKKQLFLFPLILLLLNVYVLSCWWDWGFGGSFGCRALIQDYAYLIFPFAVFVEWVWRLFSNKRVLQFATRVSMIVVFYVLIWYNLFQSWQYKFQMIHWCGMTKEAYEFSFLKKQYSEEDFRVFQSKLKLPDYGKMLHGERD